MKKKILIIVSGIGLAVLVTVAVLWFTVLRHQEPKKDTLADVLSRPRPVVIEKVSANSYAKDRSFPGVVNAIETTQLSFRIHGPLIELNVKPGDTVKKGQLLMQVDPRDFQDRIAVLEAQLAVITAKYKNAAADFERAKTLFSQNVIPQADYDSAQSAYDGSAAAVKDCQAQLQIANHELEDTSLIAPYDGIITEKYVENHEMVNVGQVVLGMHDISRLKIEVEIPENEIAKHPLTSGETIKIQFPSIQNSEYTAALREWNSSADPVTRTYTVVFVMDALQNLNIFPGMTAQASWVSENSSVPMMAVPARSVITDNQGRPFIWVFNSQSSKARKRPVETGKLIQSNQVEILKGLEPGELIISEGAGFITEDMELCPIHSNTINASSLNERSR
ncbi:MAG: efflux RND transporter periplasmic adaptor subunit [Sedimentisphaerales bacterium]|nr:efflux RND transporter periplasmic adaptor subunit [Sedimentisphaerales bacterium]